MNNHEKGHFDPNLYDKHCEFCGGPNDLTVDIKTRHNKIIPMIMCYTCFMKLIRAEGEK